MRFICVAMVVALLAACGGGAKSVKTDGPAGSGAGAGTGAAAAGGSLFDRLGGLDAITAVVDDFVTNVTADARIGAFFAKTDLAALKKHLVEQICAAAGGPCTYAGRPMAEAHAGMGVKDADFDALVEDLAKSLDAHKVAEKDKAELVALLGTMRGDIVGK